jgi:hypothetical protein
VKLDEKRLEREKLATDTEAVKLEEECLDR